MSCAGTITNKQPNSLVRHMGSSTVALVYEIEGNQKVFCTGVWVDDKKILTANHCVEAVAEANAQKEAGEGEPAIPDDLVNTPMHYVMQQEVQGVGDEPFAVHLGKAIKVDHDHDLALIEALGPVPSHDNAKLVNESPAVGERVHFVGHVKGLYWTFVDGNVAAYREEVGMFKGEFMQVSAPVWFGNSGGGVFTEDGKLCGISSFITRAAPNVAFYVHAETIRKFLLPDEDLKPPFGGKFINKD